jgi:molecular chaperone Hsp33
LPNDVLQQGIVQLSGDTDVSGGLMTYMQESEQVTSMLAVRTIVDDDTRIRAAGGYMVQLLPDASHAALAAMTEQLARFDQLLTVLSQADLSVDTLRAAVLGDIASREMTRTYLTFGCNCDRGRILASVASLPDEDIEELASAGHVLEVKCDSCGARYQIDPAEVRALLDGHASAADRSQN